jgi:hypothetical protein
VVAVSLVSIAPAGGPPPTIRRTLPWRTLAWAASVLCAVGLGYSLRSAARDGTDMASAPPATPSVLAERADDKAVAATSGAGAAAPAPRRDAAPAPSEMADAGKYAPSPAPAANQPAAPAADAVAAPTVAGRVGLVQSETESRAARNLAAPRRSAFRQVSLEEAVRTLAGSIRLVDGLEPVKVLSVPGAIIPGGDPGQEIIRVVYEDPPGRELWLDQQRPAAEAESARARSAEALIPGDTLLGSADGGSRSLRWIDQHGFLLRLTGFLPGDSLRAMVPKVH